jgi:hypothetical protein
MSNGQLAISNRQLFHTGSYSPLTISRLKSIGNEQWAIGNKQSTIISYRELFTINHFPFKINWQWAKTRLTQTFVNCLLLIAYWLIPASSFIIPAGFLNRLFGSSCSRRLFCFFRLLCCRYLFRQFCFLYSWFAFCKVERHTYCYIPRS